MRMLFMTTLLALGATAFSGESFDRFPLLVPGLSYNMLNPQFWISRMDQPDVEIMSPGEIGRYNRKNFRSCKPMKDLVHLPLVVSGSLVREMISGVSVIPKAPRFKNGSLVSQKYFSSLQNNLSLNRIQETVQTSWGITVRRTEMRTFPTADRIFSEPADFEFDRFMETALYPLEPLAVLHQSADGKWLFVQCYFYAAWVPAEDVALTDKKTLFSRTGSENFLVVTGKKVFTDFNPLIPGISEMQLDMGVSIPLVHPSEVPQEISGRNPAGNFVVWLPDRDSTGRLEWRMGLISRSDDIRVGFLPLTSSSITHQAFKFLGQRYGWGGMFNTRDCTSFLTDIFRCFGLLIPRNSGEQGKLAAGIMHNMPQEMTLDARKRLFDTLKPCTPVYMSGHAMLYLGKYQDDYYIIHDFSSLNVPGPDETLQNHKFRGVFVTPLLRTFLTDGRTYMEGLYTAREFILE
ncbi:MAG: SH3 domain-containing protein [Candidatus Wallbacteria bacterium]|nr:SH3 domain-containing protein [Candidatus Wallbacteria bacterium]